MSLRCPRCHSSQPHSEARNASSKFHLGGFYRRKSDKKVILRYLCLSCRKSFSQATYDPCCWQKKRHLNFPLFEHLASGNSQRRCAYLLRTNRKTIRRKFLFLGARALLELRKFNLIFPSSQVIEFDDLETFEHSKCKPLSITLAVESKSRRILGFSVSSMSAKGLLAAKALKKYGPRRDERAEGRMRLFHFLKGVVDPISIIKSDQNPHYTPDVSQHFPLSSHITVKGQRGAITAQGELKKINWDPLFSLNHTCAKLRADVNRLIRKTWCTTKKVSCLRYHLAIAACYHNIQLYSLKRV